MGYLDHLNELALDLRKKRLAKEAGGEFSTYVVWVQAEVLRKAKDALRPATDEDAEAVIRSQVKALTQQLDGVPGKIAPLPEGDYRADTLGKRDLLAALIPTPLEGQALIDAIHEAATAADVVIEMRSMGKIMAILKERHPGLVDGVKVKALIEHGC